MDFIPKLEDRKSSASTMEPKNRTVNRIWRHQSHSTNIYIKLLACFILCLVQFIGPCSCSAAVQLTSSNFDELTMKHDLVFLNFYADWCRFSQMLAPIFEEAAQKIAQEFPEPGKVLFGKIDCETETALGTRFHVTKYPTLKLMMNGKILKKEYRGQRSMEALSEHVRNLLRDPIHVLKTLDDLKSVEESKAAIVLYSHNHDPNSQEYITLRKVAQDLREECKFYWITDQAANPYLSSQGSTSNILLFKPSHSRLREKDMIYPGKQTSYGELSTWSTDKCIPLVREITFENAEELTEEGLPFLILFHHPDDKKSVEMYNQIVAKDLYTESGNINFLTADGVKFAHPLHHLGKTVKDLPLIAIDSFRHMYLFPKFEEMNVPGKLKEFIQDLYSGKLHREFHFGPDPTTKDTNQNLIAGGGQATSPPESAFVKLAPSNQRYSFARDEL